MSHLIGYTKFCAILLAIFAAGVAINFVWTGELPQHAEKLGATLVISYLAGALIALVSAPRSRASWEK